MNTPADLNTLLRVWEVRESAVWRIDPSRYVELSQQAISLGQYVVAADILDEALTVFPQNATILYYSALALARSGARGYAMKNVERLLVRTDLEPSLRSEALSLAGRIAKDRMMALSSGPQRRLAAGHARDYYREAWDQTGHFFPGINAATLCLLTDRAEDARLIANDVKARCQNAENTDHWLYATLGESAVLLGERDNAVHWYSKAHTAVGKRYGDLASMRRQLRLLASHTGLAEEMLNVLHMPRVALFTGHMIDQPGRAGPRFPAHIAPAVEVELAKALDDSDVGFAYCSAACGADILFIEQALTRGIEVNVILPFGREDFIRTSVGFAGDEWVSRFENALERATTTSICVDEGYLGD